MPSRQYCPLKVPASASRQELKLPGRCKKLPAKKCILTLSHLACRCTNYLTSPPPKKKEKKKAAFELEKYVINLMVIVTFPFSSRILAIFIVNTIFNFL
jgi:hypothetical protein